MIGIQQNVSACAAFLGYLQRSEPNSQDPGVQLWPLVYTAADPASLCLSITHPFSLPNAMCCTRHIISI